MGMPLEAKDVAGAVGSVGNVVATSPVGVPASASSKWLAGAGERDHGFRHLGGRHWLDDAGRPQFGIIALVRVDPGGVITIGRQEDPGPKASLDQRLRLLTEGLLSLSRLNGFHLQSSNPSAPVPTEQVCGSS